MAVVPEQLRILSYPDPRLRQRAAPVERIDEPVRAVARRMVELMGEAEGVGLAAPQVGLAWRMFVANPAGEPGEAQVFINPVLREPSRETEPHAEGCLSLPQVTGQITRPVGITIEAVDEQGEPVKRTAEGLEARVWQHEYDHLEGVLIIDRMPPADRRANKRLLRELEKG